MTLCVLGCHDPATEQPRTAEPGWYTCQRCADKLAGVLADVAHHIATLGDPVELAPTSDSSTRGAPGHGSRSPARDDLIAHTDPRTRWTPDDGHGALAVMHSWARVLREDHGAAQPPGPATVTSEAGTLRWHWETILAAPWLDEFAAELREVLAVLQAAEHTQRVRTMRLGPCTRCGTSLRVRIHPPADNIRCFGCDSSWPRATWSSALGDPWIDYARLSELTGVTVGTLWRWCSTDGWRTSGTRARRLVHRLDALDSHTRRRREPAG